MNGVTVLFAQSSPQQKRKRRMPGIGAYTAPGYSFGARSYIAIPITTLKKPTTPKEGPDTQGRHMEHYRRNVTLSSYNNPVPEELVVLLDRYGGRNTNYYQVLTGPFMCGHKHKLLEDALVCACDNSVPRKGASIVQRSPEAFRWSDYDFTRPANHAKGGKLVPYYARKATP